LGWGGGGAHEPKTLEKLRLREEDNIEKDFQEIKWGLGLNCCD
jgi:hypothetical protein